MILPSNIAINFLDQVMQRWKGSAVISEKEKNNVLQSVIVHANKRSYFVIFLAETSSYPPKRRPVTSYVRFRLLFADRSMGMSARFLVGFSLNVFCRIVRQTLTAAWTVRFTPRLRRLLPKRKWFRLIL